MTTTDQKHDSANVELSQSEQPTHRFTTGRAAPIFCDGVSQVAVGYPLSRIVFNNHPAKVSSDGREVTHFVAAELIIPTNGLAQLAQQLVVALIDSQAQIDSVGAEWNKELLEIIDHLKSPRSLK